MSPARKALANTGGVKLRGPKFQQTFSNMGPHVGPTIWQLSIWLVFNCPDSAAGHVPISRMLFVSTRHQPLSANAYISGTSRTTGTSVLSPFVCVRVAGKI